MAFVLSFLADAVFVMIFKAFYCQLDRAAGVDGSTDSASIASAKIHSLDDSSVVVFMEDISQFYEITFTLDSCNDF